jgi:hypothetical protein
VFAGNNGTSAKPVTEEPDDYDTDKENETEDFEDEEN